MEQAILTWFNQTAVHPILDVVMAGSTLLGLFLFLASGIYYYHTVSRRFGQAIFLALFAALVAALLFQYLAFRPRPDGVRLILAQPNTPSFPSGHAAVSFAAATVIALYKPDWLTGLAALGTAILVSVSRLYLGHHYPSDIVGGIMLGIGIGLPVYGLLLAPENGRGRFCHDF